VKLAVVAYPVFQKRVHRWIEALRARLDPQASKIRAHFTLVFPVDVVESRRIEKRLATTLSGCRSISFIIREAQAMRDLCGRRHHVLLVPRKGRKALIGLHDKIYADPFRPHLRKDISFMPHVTVAESDAAKFCGLFADELNRTKLALRGIVRDIELIEVRERSVRRIARFVLKNDKLGYGTQPAPLRSSAARRRT
jgi:2'-5' RNA ligase